MPSRPLGGAAIRSLVEEVADRLEPSRSQHVLILVGGSLLQWHDLRDSTEDVDTIERLDDELRTAVASVAVANDLRRTG